MPTAGRESTAGGWRAGRAVAARLNTPVRGADGRLFDGVTGQDPAGSFGPTVRVGGHYCFDQSPRPAIAGFLGSWPGAGTLRWHSYTR